MKKLEKEKELAKSLSQDIWVESDDYWICNPCLFHSKSAPKPLLTLRRGNFGFVSNTGQNSVIVDHKKRHSQSKLHEWCVDEYQRSSELKSENDKKNEVAAKKIIRNVLICFKRSWSSADFVALNAKDFLAERDLGTSNNATKGDSKVEFFRQRTIIFDLLTVKIQRFFDENVQDISVTLDKGTKYLGFFLLQIGK